MKVFGIFARNLIKLVNKTYEQLYKNFVQIFEIFKQVFNNFIRMYSYFR